MEVKDFNLHTGQTETRTSQSFFQGIFSLIGGFQALKDPHSNTICFYNFCRATSEVGLLSLIKHIHNKPDGTETHNILPKQMRISQVSDLTISSRIKIIFILIPQTLSMSNLINPMAAECKLVYHNSRKIFISMSSVTCDSHFVCQLVECVVLIFTVKIVEVVRLLFS